MFSILSNKSQGLLLASDMKSTSNSEDDHYEEVEDSYSFFDDGIRIDSSFIDEYEDIEDEMESDIPEPEDSENIDHFNYVDAIEAEHYDSLEDE